MSAPTQRQLLTIATVAECLAGLALMVTPDAIVRLLLGAEPGEVGLMIARIAGVALLALGIACWGARASSGDAARASTLRAITVYNAGVGLLLIAFVATGKAYGVAVWIVGLLHLALAVAFAASAWRLIPASATQSGR
jgi:hypothetical protein